MKGKVVILPNGKVVMLPNHWSLVYRLHLSMCHFPQLRIFERIPGR